MTSALRLASICALLAAWACTTSRAEPEVPEPPADPRDAAGDPAADAEVERGAQKGDCGEAVCAYHPGADRYHRCAHAAEGACVRFGPPCEPADRCMYDRRREAYRSCERAREGRCVEFGGACAPAGDCMFDAEGERHRVCEQVTGGRCERFGPACAPEQLAR